MLLSKLLPLLTDNLWIDLGQTLNDEAVLSSLILAEVGKFGVNSNLIFKLTIETLVVLLKSCDSVGQGATSLALIPENLFRRQGQALEDGLATVEQVQQVLEASER